MSDPQEAERRLSLREEALAIWQAGVDAVTPKRLFSDKVSVEGSLVTFGDELVDLATVGRLVVVGGGKAAAGMATELYQQVLCNLPSEWQSSEWEDVDNKTSTPKGNGPLDQQRIVGCVNCPEGTFESSSQAGPIRLQAARPAGVNEPTRAAIAGTQQMLSLVQTCEPTDLVLCLISGGGSALLVAPCEGISLADKQHVARLVSAAGGNIEQLNTVRRALSDVKGGGLARACNAKRMITLIISDVLGDPLDLIASGPTYLQVPSNAESALNVLRHLGLGREPELANVVQFLTTKARQEGSNPSSTTPLEGPLPEVTHVVLANNADAVDAAGIKAVELGYRYVMQTSQRVEGDVTQVADHATSAIEQLCRQDQVDCWISGGEPTVNLPPPSERGSGGRNQQLALEVITRLHRRGWPQQSADFPRDLTMVSGGTDGEDGPTDAAGACFDQPLWRRAQDLGLDPSGFLQRADAYEFFRISGGLVKTGPTGTNVCDLRVALAGKRPA